MKNLLYLLFLIPLIIIAGCKKDDDESPDYVEPSITFEATPSNPKIGENTQLVWEVTGLFVEKVFVYLDGVLISTKLSDMLILGPVNKEMVIDLFVMAGKDEPIQRTVTISPKSKPTLTVNADPLSLPIGGGTTTLSWSAVNADTVMYNDTPYGPTGSLDVNLVEDSTFTFLAKGPGGQKSASISVTVEPAPPIPTALDTLVSGKWYLSAEYQSCPEKNIWRRYYPIGSCLRDDFRLFKYDNYVNISNGEVLCEGENHYLFNWEYSFFRGHYSWFWRTKNHKKTNDRLVNLGI
jgi:hypothetical protein